jgi:ABC-type antimicrobial peptide transport system permease subunit
MARRSWPGTSPLGKRIRYPWAGAPWIEVVGVVGSVADGDLAAPRRPRWYVPLAQRPAPNVTLVARSALPPSAIGPALRRAVAEVDPRLPVSQEASYAELMGESAAGTRLTAGVLLAFALATLFLGCLGVHAVAAHMVRERRREIGVRMALGAGAGAILTEVVREGLGVAVPAALLGLLLAALASRGLSGMLYGVSPTDPLTFAGVALLTLAAVGAALWLPARRAVRTDPVESLRGG